MWTRPQISSRAHSQPDGDVTPCITGLYFWAAFTPHRIWRCSEDAAFIFKATCIFVLKKPQTFETKEVEIRLSFLSTQMSQILFCMLISEIPLRLSTVCDHRLVRSRRCRRLERQEFEGQIKDGEIKPGMGLRTDVRS